MSGTTQSPPPRDIVRDIFLWRRKKLSVAILVLASATWVVLEVYQFNFITVASWVAITILATLFTWANILRLLGKESPKMSEVEIWEETAVEIGKSIREWIEEGVRWMFGVSVEREWYVFGGVVAAFCLISVVGTFFHLLTLLYIGIVVGMTVPVIYVKYDYKIREYSERLKVQCHKLYIIIHCKVESIVKNKKQKEKKIE